jgi:putative protease
VRWEETSDGRASRLNGVLIDQFAAGEAAGYPTLCKGRFKVEGNIYHAMEEPTSLNALDILPALIESGVKAIKVEGRQRSPAYVAQVTKLLRSAIDDCMRSDFRWTPRSQITEGLDALAEGRTHTLGAYHRPWQ